MPQPPTYHAKKSNSNDQPEPYGAPVTTQRHPAFCTTNFKRPGQPVKTISVKEPKRIVDQATIHLLDELGRSVLGCECAEYRCCELKNEGRQRCGRHGNVILSVKHGRAQRCPDCRIGKAKS
jgi:hypothetical protein